MKRDWLIAIRREKKYTQSYVSQQVGIKSPSYCAIERGKTTPSVQNAKAIASILGFDWTQFFDDNRS